MDINANPAVFLLRLPTGEEVSIEDLRDGELPDYSGPAVLWRLKPKGAGAAFLTVDGEPYPLEKDKTYTITAESMTVNLYNDKRNKHGRAVGHWYVRIVEASSATITVH
jgi:hypothetical protein